MNKKLITIICKPQPSCHTEHLIALNFFTKVQFGIHYTHTYPIIFFPKYSSLHHTWLWAIYIQALITYMITITQFPHPACQAITDPSTGVWAITLYPIKYALFYFSSLDVDSCIFLHDRPWILPWIKSIVLFAIWYHFSCSLVTIAGSHNALQSGLWRHY